MTPAGRTGGLPSVRVGVIGVGYLGQHHARIYSQLPGVTLIGVADTVRERADEVAKAA
ncbi:MAG TPA: Gfo/Idh/MocA family oxidoreductase, partial [Nitrospiria bacterium]|nr:Gfo/Idh/MocA family oxidoreductase [Nitrospiria bacterium]